MKSPIEECQRDNEGYLCTMTKTNEVVAYRPSEICTPENFDVFKTNPKTRGEYQFAMLWYYVAIGIPALTYIGIVWLLISFGVWDIGLFLLILAGIAGSAIFFVYIAYKWGKDSYVSKCRDNIPMYFGVYVDAVEDHFRHIPSKPSFIRMPYNAQDLRALVDVYPDEWRVPIAKVRELKNWYEKEMVKAKLEGGMVGYGMRGGSGGNLNINVPSRSLK